VSSTVLVLLADRTRGMTGMIIIGVDPHKLTHTASAVDAAGYRPAGSLQAEASLVG